MSDWSDYFKRRIEFDKPRKVLKPLDKPCGDCAVVNGLYREIADELAKEPIEIRKASSEKWFCHNHTDRACRGNWNRQSLDE